MVYVYIRECFPPPTPCDIDFHHTTNHNTNNKIQTQQLCSQKKKTKDSITQYLTRTTIMSADKDNTSTLQAAIDSVSGTVQSAIGAVTGSTADQTKGDAKQDKASAEHDASKAAVKLPGATVSASGVSKDDPDRSAGSYNQAVGSAKETVGHLVGSEVGLIATI